MVVPLYWFIAATGYPVNRWSLSFFQATQNQWSTGGLLIIILAHSPTGVHETGN